MGTAGLEERDLMGDTRVAERLRRTAFGEEDTLSSGGIVVDGGDFASAARTGEGGDFGRHCRRGEDEESGDDEGNVEWHFV